MPATADTTLAVLRHLSVHGLSSKDEIQKAMVKLPASTVSNLLHLGHIRSDRTHEKTVRYAITPRGLAKLQGLALPRKDSPAAKAKHAPAGAPVPTASLRPRSLDAYALPSRVGNRLHWPDGRVTGLDHNPITPKDHHGR